MFVCREREQVRSLVGEWNSISTNLFCSISLQKRLEGNAKKINEKLVKIRRRFPLALPASASCEVKKLFLQSASCLFTCFHLSRHQSGSSLKCFDWGLSKFKAYKHAWHINYSRTGDFGIGTNWKEVKEESFLWGFYFWLCKCQILICFLC